MQSPQLGAPSSEGIGNDLPSVYFIPLPFGEGCRLRENYFGAQGKGRSARQRDWRDERDTITSECSKGRSASPQ